MHYLTFDFNLRVEAACNVAQYPLHHVVDAATKFEVATSNGLGGDAFTRKLFDLTRKMLSTVYIM